MELLFDPAIPLLGIYPKKPETLIGKSIWTPMFISVLLTIVKIWKQPKYPGVAEWIKQVWGIYTMEQALAVQKKETVPFVAVWMDLENIMLSELCQAEKEKYHVISLVSGI